MTIELKQKNMKFLLFFLSLTSIQVVAQQSSNNIEKLIVKDKYGFFCKIKEDGLTILKKINLNSNQQDSLQIFYKPEGIFKDHPIVWDLHDSIIFHIRLHNDGGGMTYPELRAYQSRKIAEYTSPQSSNEYIFSNETLKDKDLGPLYYYMRRIYYREDTLKGPLFFDISVRKDSLFLYVYIHDKKVFEVWNFNRYPLIVKKLNNSEANQIIKKKTWELYKKIPAEIHGPFQLVEINDKVYAFDYSGYIWDLSGTNARKERSFPAENKRGALVVNKDEKTVKYFKNREIDRFNKDFKNYMEKSSVDIKIK